MMYVTTCYTTKMFYNYRIINLKTQNIILNINVSAKSVFPVNCALEHFFSMQCNVIKLHIYIRIKFLTQNNFCFKLKLIYSAWLYSTVKHGIKDIFNPQGFPEGTRKSKDFCGQDIFYWNCVPTATPGKILYPPLLLNKHYSAWKNLIFPFCRTTLCTLHNERHTN